MGRCLSFLIQTSMQRCRARKYVEGDELQFNSCDHRSKSCDHRRNSWLQAAKTGSTSSSSGTGVCGRQLQKQGHGLRMVQDSRWGCGPKPQTLMPTCQSSGTLPRPPWLFQGRLFSGTWWNSSAWVVGWVPPAGMGHCHRYGIQPDKPAGDQSGLWEAHARQAAAQRHSRPSHHPLLTCFGPRCRLLSHVAHSPCPSNPTTTCSLFTQPLLLSTYMQPLKRAS